MIDEIITYLVEGLNILMQSIWGALFFLLVGALLLRYSIKKPTTIFNLRGLVGGIALIVGGLLILYLKLTGNT